MDDSSIDVLLIKSPAGWDRVIGNVWSGTNTVPLVIVFLFLINKKGGGLDPSKSKLHSTHTLFFI